AAERQGVAGNFMLMLDARPQGWLNSVDGGTATAEVVTEPGGASPFTKKHLGAVRYEEFCLQFGLGMDRPVYDWIAASWQRRYMRKSGSIVAADYKLTAMGQRDFENAVITEVTIPDMDVSAAGKVPGRLTVKIQPERVASTKVSGKIGAAAQPTKTK